MCDDFDSGFDGGDSGIDTSFDEVSFDADVSDSSFEVDSVMDAGSNDFEQFELPAETDSSNVVEYDDNAIAEPIEAEIEQLEIPNEIGTETADDASDVAAIMDAGEDDFEQFEIPSDSAPELQDETEILSDIPADSESDTTLDEPTVLEPDETIETPHDDAVEESIELETEPVADITPTDIQEDAEAIQEEMEQDAASLDDKFVEQTDLPYEIEEQIEVADAVATEEIESLPETDTAVEPESDSDVVNQILETPDDATETIVLEPTAEIPIDSESDTTLDEPTLLEPDEAIEIPHDDTVEESIELETEPVADITPKDIQEDAAAIQEEMEQDAAALDDKFVEQTDLPYESEEQVEVADAVATEEIGSSPETDTEVEPQSDSEELETEPVADITPSDIQEDVADIQEEMEQDGASLEDKFVEQDSSELATNETTEATEISEIEDIQTWLGDINPNYDPDVDNEYSNNCGSCALATLKKFDGIDTAVASAETLSIEEMNKETGMEQVEMTPDSMQDYIVEQGAGKMYVVGIDRQPPLAGHWFNAYYDGKKVVAIDSQTNTIHDWPPKFNAINWDINVRKEKTK